MNKDGYTYTKEEVESMLRFLRIQAPAIATPENSVKVLVYCHDYYKTAEDIAPEELEKIVTELEKQ